MDGDFLSFEATVRRVRDFTSEESQPLGAIHPFEERHIHPSVRASSERLFDDGHFSQATFEAFKLLDRTVAELAGLQQSGFSMVMQALSEKRPLIQLNSLLSESDLDEQKGFQFIIAGAIMALRNPRAHDVGVTDTYDQCLDYLALASMLLRRLDGASHLEAAS